MLTKPLCWVTFNVFHHKGCFILDWMVWISWMTDLCLEFLSQWSTTPMNSNFFNWWDRHSSNNLFPLNFNNSMAWVRSSNCNSHRCLTINLRMKCKLVLPETWLYSKCSFKTKLPNSYTSYNLLRHNFTILSLMQNNNMMPWPYWNKFSNPQFSDDTNWELVNFDLNILINSYVLSS